MKKILITGKNGLLSKSAYSYLSQKPDLSVDIISLRGEAWKKTDLSVYDSIVHCAGVIPKEGIETEAFYTVNHKLTEKLANKAKSDGVKQFVFISSMAVYGIKPSIKNGIVYENTACNPDSDYGKSKLLGERSVNQLKSSCFKTVLLRTPSIYCKDNYAYFSQYEYLINKFKILPIAFKDCIRSAIYIDNLCELIYLIIENEHCGIVCPSDNDFLGTVDYCTLISDKSTSRFMGKLIEILFKNNSIINSLYGSVAYSPELTNIFEGKYRIVDAETAIKEIYSENAED